MALPRYLKCAPVVEALLDITARFPKPVDPAEFTDLHKDIAADYPIVETRQGFQFTLPVAPKPNFAPPPIVPSGILAYVFRAADSSKVVQSRRDGLAFSQLTPYQGWDSAIREAIRLWQAYQIRYQPERVLRLAVRYINRLKLPGPTLDFDDYLVGTPKIPVDLPQGLSEFSVSYVIPLAAKTAGRVHLAFNAVEMSAADVPVLLDINVTRECDIDPADAAALETSFADLRAFKNRLFFGTLTEKAAEFFE
jgi:uncharacterized protein (TIGR04255 family)